MSTEDKNQNGKRNTETKLTGKKARKLSKKRSRIEKLKKVLEGTSQKENLQNWSFARISKQRHGTSLWRSNIVIGDIITIRVMLQMGRKKFMVHHQTVGLHHNRSNRFNEGLIPVASDPLSSYLFIPLCQATRTLLPTENLSLQTKFLSYNDNCILPIFFIVTSKLIVNPISLLLSAYVRQAQRNRRINDRSTPRPDDWKSHVRERIICRGIKFIYKNSSSIIVDCSRSRTIPTIQREANQAQGWSSEF